MNKKSYLSLILCLVTTTGAWAQQKITFNEAIELAINNNLEVKASYEAFKASEFDKKSARAPFFPKLSAGISYEKVNNTPEGGYSSTNDSYGASLNLNQNLFKGFQDSANLKIAESNLLISQASLQETKAQISFDLKNALANYFYAKDSLNLFTDIKKRREGNLRMVELRFENGRENKGSTLLSRAYLEQSKLDLMRAQNAMNTSMTFLRRVLNLPEDVTVEIVDIPLPKEVSETPPDFNSLIEETPTAKRFKATLENATATLEVKQSAFYPSWDVSASLGKTGNDFFPDNNKRWTAGTSLSWSIFEGGKDFYSTSSGNLLVKAAEKRLENQNMELRRILKDSFTAYDESLLTVKVSAAFLEAAKVRSDIARSKYNNGLTNFDDWDLIENDLIIKQKDYILKLRDRLISEASWEKARGTGVIP